MLVGTLQPRPRPASTISACTKCFSSNYTRKIIRDTTVSNLPPPRINYKAIIESPSYHAQNIQNRKIKQAKFVHDHIQLAYAKHGSLLASLNNARREQNEIGEVIRLATTEQERSLAVRKAKELKNFLAIQEPLTSGEEKHLLELGLRIPNITHPDSPIGPEANAKVLSLHGPDRMKLDAKRDHWRIAKQLDLVDFDSAAVTTGSAWYFLKGAAALLEQALVNHALSIAIKHGYTPMSTPDVIKSDIATRCGFSPRDQTNPYSHKIIHHFYHLEGTSNELVLAGTAEIPMAGMYAQRIFTEGDLPCRTVAVGHAFRSEAGARGADARGLYRVHQFTKVELFAVTEEHKSGAMMEEIRKIQIEIFEGLGFPFRVLDMPTEELGHAAYRKYDIEAWMPGRGGWGEISSTSNCLDFQARRLHIRYRPTHPTTNSDGMFPIEDEKKGLPFAHTLNGTAAAIPRLIVALLENGVQLNEANQAVGLALPSTLRRFWLGGDSLGPYAKITWFDPPLIDSRND